MIEQIETLTFIFDHIDQKNKFKIFRYIEEEDLKIHFIQMGDELPESVVYYPVYLPRIKKSTNYFDFVSPEAIELAKQEKLVIVYFFDHGDEDYRKVRHSLVSQIITADITIKDVRFVTANKLAETIPPFIYFPFAELYSRDSIVKLGTEYDEKIRTKKFQMNCQHDSSANRLFAASLWYHGMHDLGYFNYDVRAVPRIEEKDEVRSWSKLWSSTGTLMDMFSLQLPYQCEIPPEGKTVYSDSYWSYITEPFFIEDTCFLSEKVFKSIAYLHPFIMIAPPKTLKLLHTLGYLTFENYANEAYDSIAEHENRMQSLFRLTYEMNNLSMENHAKLHENILPILRHNQQHYIESRKYRLLNLLNQIKERKE